MTPVHLPEDLERFIRDAVRGGLYPDEGAVIADALVRLRNAIDTDANASDDSGSRSGPGQKLTKQKLHRHLIKIGLLDQPPGTDLDAGDTPGVIEDEAEIVDEVVIRERLIEWLTGFLDK